MRRLVSLSLVSLSLACLTLAATPATAQHSSGGDRGGRGGQNGAGQTPTTSHPAAGSERATIMVEPVGMLIATFDSDGDGRVSRAELAAGVARTYKARDAAGSGRMGYIDYADWAARWLGDADALPSPFTVDANGDNVITLDELQRAIAHVYARLDIDDDGVVTRKELLTIHSAPNGGGFGGGARHRGGKDRGSP